MKKLARLTPLALALLTTACSTDQMLMQNRVDYRTQSSNISKAALEVPPDLSSVADNPAVDIPTRNIITAGQVAGSARKLLPSVDSAKIVTDGSQSWLVVQLPVEQVWPVLKQFWQENGFKFVSEKMEAGLLETDWQQNSAKMEQGFFASVFGRKVSAAERDSYLIRVARTSGGTEIHIRHRGLTEGGMFGPSWLVRAGDPELESAMTALLLQKFGLDAKEAKTVTAERAPEQAKRSKQGNVTTLELTDDFDRAWRRVGLAIERAGYEVIDRNRSEGSFIVRKSGLQMDKKEDEGFFSKLAFWRSDEKKAAMAEYTLLLKTSNKTTSLSAKARDAGMENGEAPLLDALLIQLR
jgi:outer membrane protein assembly factor BamC